jgi:hypothetical protein
MNFTIKFEKSQIPIFGQFLQRAKTLCHPSNNFFINQCLVCGLFQRFVGPIGLLSRIPGYPFNSRWCEKVSCLIDIKVKSSPIWPYTQYSCEIKKGGKSSTKKAQWLTCFKQFKIKTSKQTRAKKNYGKLFNVVSFKFSIKLRVFCCSNTEYFLIFHSLRFHKFLAYFQYAIDLTLSVRPSVCHRY